ncbi:MAG TPA: putative baseplate assembly protein [Desulfatiglandales bacterium]|nr:putative baseplate assembly protein [Desulfatiglandales bacterium]
MIIEPPKVDKRTFSLLAETILSMVPHYTPEWKAGDGDAGTALARIHAFITEMVITRLNQVPRKSLIAFLDMLGIKLLPAQPSRVPVIFNLVQGTERDILIPPRTQATADKTEEHEEVPFETEKNLLAVVSKLKEVISVDPSADAIYVHTPDVMAADGSVRDRQDAFTLFTGTDQQEHSLYLGQKDLLNIKGRGEINLAITVPPAPGNAVMDVDWEYWGEDKEKKLDRWISLEVASDGTDGLSHSGEIVLYKGFEGGIKEAKLKDIFASTGRIAIKNAAISDMKNRWIRARLASRLTGTICSKLPMLDTVFLKTAPAEPVPIDAGFFNDVPLDFTKKKIRGEIIERAAILSKREFANVFPFGSQPKLYDAFYIGNKEVLSKKGAKISLSFYLFINDESNGLTPPPAPKLTWEYWDGKGWQALTIKDGTNRLMTSGENKIEFLCPIRIQETEAFGQTNYWIRARIIGGDYGREQYAVEAHNKITVQRMFKVPVILELTASYHFEESVEPEVCLTYNNLDFEDMTTQAVTPNVAFSPYVPLTDKEKAFYLGFDGKLQGGPICIFFDAVELQYEEESKPNIEWRFSNGQDWSAVDYLDETEGFVAQGLLELIGPTGFAPQVIFGASLYWLRGGLVKGAYESLPNIRGIFPNTAWSIQAQTIRNEILGSSNGEPDQTFAFFKFPVMEGEELRVREVLTDEERQQLIATFGRNAISETTDETGAVTETWVLWKEVPDFFYSSDKSRHYIIDRATGQISFGSGVNGMIPSAGEDSIKAFSYQTGGGIQGNVKALEVKSLKSAVSGVDKVINPIAADGGADTATVDETIEIGPAIISHRYRAVTIEDFEWLARMASRKVVRARCLPNRNNEGQSETGWVTIIIVPESTAEKPYPSLLLKKEVQEYLSAHSLSTIASPGHIHVNGPTYIEMSLSVDLFVTTIDAASSAAREAKQRLAVFFHPLTGGPEGEGWDFGRGVAVSDVYALLEGIEGVDHIEHLIFSGVDEGDFVSVPPNALVANGEHTINARLKKGG